MRIEAETLQQAFEKAAHELNCSVAELPQIKVIQKPFKGIFGFFKRPAIIEVEGVFNKKPKSINDLDDPFSEENEVFDAVEAIEDIDSAVEDIKKKIKHLFEVSCFDLDEFEVKKLDEETIFIKIDGPDAALLIGKEGYRYNALNYMLYHWISSKYGYKVKLEIAEFLEVQEEMLKTFLKPFIEKVKERGYGKTKPFNGILVYIALEILREAFPDKYVAIKERNGEKFIVVGDRDEHYSSDIDA